MKQIVRIAKLELKQLFFSPIAWLVFIFFILQMGGDFVERTNGMFHTVLTRYKMDSLTSSWFRDFWIYVQRNLLYYIPLLTMGLMSREKNSGTMRLLLSSPVRSIEIVLGKYISMLVIGTAMVALLAAGILVAGTTIENPDYGLMVSGLIGTWCLICTYSAVGLFISNLTSYQVVSVIGTLAIFSLLDLMRTVWQDKDFFRELTWFLAISGRASWMNVGLISSEDVGYFVLIVMLFLGYVVIGLETRRKGASFSKKLLYYWGYTFVILLLGYCTTRPAKIAYLDMTANKAHTLTKQSVAVVKKIREPLSNHIYDNVLDGMYWLGTPGSVITNRKLFDNYQQYLPVIKTHVTFYYDSVDNPQVFNPSNRGKPLSELAGLVLKNFEFKPEKMLKPEEMKQQYNLDEEDHRLVQQLRIGNKASNLRYFNDEPGMPMEDEITATLKRMTDGVQTVGFVRGHGERDFSKLLDSKGFKLGAREFTYRYSLRNYGFDVTGINLLRGAVPDSISILVIADASETFTADEIHAVKVYIEKGGNLLVMGEPGNQSVLNDITRLAGVTFLPGRATQRSKDYGPEYIRATLTADAIAQDTCLYQPAAAKGFMVDLDGAMALSFRDTAGFTMKPILTADSFIMAMSVTRRVQDKEQRIFVIGDADFMNNQVLESWYPVKSVPKTRANFDVYTETFHWLSRNEYPVYASTARTRSIDNDYRITKKKADLIEICVLYLLPGILILAGSILMIRRKRK